MNGPERVHPAVVVTALVELESGVPGVYRRSIDDFLQFGIPVLSMDIPLVVFCDEALVERVAARRAELAPGVPTVVAPFEWHPEAVGDVEFLRSAIAAGRSASASNEAKDTAESLALAWSKPYQLQRAAALMPAHQYWWMDFGIAHVAEVPTDLARSLQFDSSSLGHPPLHLVTLRQGEWFRETENWKRVVLGAGSGHPDWWRHGAQLVCGGVFGVSASAVDHLAQWVREVAQEAISVGVPVTEEMFLSRIALVHRNAVRLTDAAYPALLIRLADSLVPSITDLCPSAQFSELPGPARADRAALNPSIANDPDGGYRVVIRHVNYRYDHGNYRHLDSSSAIVTENQLVRLDEDFNVLDARAIDDRLARTDPPQCTVHGLEDMRLFRHRGAWWVSATLREHRPDGLCEIVAAELDSDARIVAAHLMSSPAGLRHEKNWAPIEGADRIEFLWNTEPPVRLGLDTVLQVTTLGRALPVPTECSSARGGSQVIRVPGGWLTVVHHAHTLRDRVGERREYRHRLIHYDDRWNIRATSQEFSFQFAGIEFCAGLARTRTGVVMSFGVEDCVARLVSISWADVWSMLGLVDAEAGPFAA